MTDSEPLVIPAAGVAVGFTPADEPGKIACHLIAELPPPIGRLHILLTPDQVLAVHDPLHRAITATDEQARDFINYVRGEHQ